jgi:hypothetical protein
MRLVKKNRSDLAPGRDATRRVGHAGRDTVENRFLKTCDITPTVSETLARRAALLRRLARRGSAVDALVVACAEPGGTVITTDTDDLEALAAHAQDVNVVTV